MICVCGLRACVCAFTTFSLPTPHTPRSTNDSFPQSLAAWCIPGLPRDRVIDDRANGHALHEPRYRRPKTRTITCVVGIIYIYFVFPVATYYRAQSDADARRAKADLLKGKCTVVGARKDVANHKPQHHQQQPLMAPTGDTHAPAPPLPHTVDAKCVAEVKRLRSENAILKDANKQLEEKNTVRLYYSRVVRHCLNILVINDLVRIQERGLCQHIDGNFVCSIASLYVGFLQSWSPKDKRCARSQGGVRTQVDANV